MVIHGGIDGFTRIPVFLKCSTNNRAETVLDAFLKATQEYGLPSRVRSDKAAKILLSLCICYNTLRGGQGEEA